MTDAILMEVNFAENRWLDHVDDSSRVREALKTILFTMAHFILAVAAFVGLLKLCKASDLSLWWAAVPYIALYVAWTWRQCVVAIPFLLLAGTAHADGVVSAVVGFVVEAMQDPDDGGSDGSD